MKQRLAIINPAAGAGRCGRQAIHAIAELRTRGVPVEAWYTRNAGHAGRLARKAYAEGFRHFLAVGGDGTAHEIVNGLSDALATTGEERVSLGFLPLGTGNSFLRDFGRVELDDAIDRLANATVRPCDVLKIVHAEGELYSINIVSFGFVADVCRLAQGRLKRLGSGGYALAVLAELGRLGELQYAMQLDDNPRWQQPAIVLSVHNSKFTGGEMQLAPFADVSDGLLDVTLVQGIPLPTFLALFAKIFSGQHVHHPAVTTAQGRQIRFEFPGPSEVMVDGDVKCLDVREIRVIPSALDIFV